MVSEEPRWVEFSELELESGILSVSDTSYFFDDFIAVKLSPGRYRVSVLQDVDGDVARIRVDRNEVGRLGKKLGAVGVDFAQIGVCDRIRTEIFFKSLGNDGMTEYFDLLGSDLFGEIRLGPIVIAFCRSGLGDGEYDVFELVNDSGTRIGIEVDFEIFE